MITGEMDLGLFIALAKRYGGGGTSDYAKLNNLPKINGVTLTGNKSNKDLKINTIVTSEEDVTVSGKSVPKLTEDQVKEIATGFAKGTNYSIENVDKTKSFQVLAAEVDDPDLETYHIYVLFEDKLLLTYHTNGTIDFTTLGGAGGLVGFVTNGDSFPTTRPDGSALKDGDYVKADPNSTFPFTIGSVLFLSRYTEGVYFNSTWTAEDESEAIIECTTLPTTNISDFVIYHLTATDGDNDPGYYVHYNSKWIRLDSAISIIDNFPDTKSATFNKEKLYFLNVAIENYLPGMYFFSTVDSEWQRLEPINIKLIEDTGTIEANVFAALEKDFSNTYFTYDNNKYDFSHLSSTDVIYSNAIGELRIDISTKAYKVINEKAVFNCSATSITYLDSIYSVPDVFGATSFSFDDLIDSYKDYKHTILIYGNVYAPIIYADNANKFIIVSYKDKGVIKYTNGSTQTTEYIPYAAEKKTLSSTTGTLAEVDYNNLINSVDNVILYDGGILKYNNADTTDVYYKNSKYTCKITKSTRAYVITSEAELSTSSSVSVIYLDKTYAVPDFSNLDADVISEYFTNHRSCSVKYNDENVEIVHFDATANTLRFYYDDCIVEETLGTKAANVVPLYGVGKSLSSATGTLSATDYANLISNADNYIIYNNKHILKLENKTSTAYKYKGEVYCCDITISSKAYTITSVYKSVKGAIV